MTRSKAEATARAVRIAFVCHEQIAVTDDWDDHYGVMLYKECVEGLDDIVAVVSPDGSVEDYND